MFRPIRRKDRELSLEAAKELLHSARRGILAMRGEDGYPYAIPLNYIYDENEQKICFHGARTGHKVDAINACDKVCFTVYGEECIKKEEWAPFVQSVVLFGKCHIIEDNQQAMVILKKLAEKYYPNETLIDEVMVRSGKVTQMYEISIEHITGKEIQEK